MKGSLQVAVLFALSIELCLVASLLLVKTTIQDKASGAEVVEATIQKIIQSNIFPDDFGFLRRIAYVESRDGTDANTFTKPNGKGIWQLDRIGFDDTQDTTAHPSLTAKLASINRMFGIDWSTVTYDDMNKPLHNALAARLLLSNKPGTIPVDLRAQAQYWKDYYNGPTGAGTVDKFISDVTTLESKQVQCNTPSLDVVFVLDSSGSIGSDNFLKILSFVQTVGGFFDIGENKVHVGVIEFSNNVLPVISLNQTYSVTILKQAIGAITYLSSGTNTAGAIDELVDNAFLESKGARPLSQGVPRVGIVVTDGQSNDAIATQIAAGRAHAANIRMFAIGVGSGSNMAELNSIGTDPDSMHVFLLSAFTDFLSFANQLKRLTCAASTILSKGQRNVIGELQKDQKRYIQTPISQDQGGTIQVTVVQGEVVIYVSMTYANPSEVLYDSKASVKTGNSANIYAVAPIGNTRSKRALSSNGTSNNTVPAYVTIQGISDNNSFQLNVVDGKSGAASHYSVMVGVVCLLCSLLFTAP